MASDATPRTTALDLLKELQDLLVRGPALPAAAESKIAKQQACKIAHRLWLELEEPGDIVDRIVFQPQENAMLRVGLDLGIYDMIENSPSPMTAPQVAEKTKADLVLTERILRNLAAVGHIDEAGASGYRGNKATKAFTMPKGIHLGNFFHEFLMPAWAQVPDFLKSIGYQNPTDPLNTPTQRAFNSQKHYFELLVQQNVLDVFQKAMETYRVGRAECLDVFPAQECLIDGLESSDADESVLLVDVGGGHGHEILKFRERFPNVKARMILQDQQDVIAQVADPKGMELMVHDFFTPQPVKGARCYYIRMVLHNWPDEQSLVILKHLAASMKPGYSKVIINDLVLPDQGATRFAAQSDINMMTLLSAMERSETRWRRLLEQAGLEVIKIWPGAGESVIEATLKAV